MGVLYDYFRASDDAAAVALMAQLDGGPVITWSGISPVDAVDLKGLDPTVTLGKLVGMARGVDWSPGLTGGELIWCRSEESGPCLTSIDDGARDTLASISDARLPDLAERWGQTEELVTASGPVPVDDMLRPLMDIVGLAQRAQAAGDHLYCWCCL